MFVIDDDATPIVVACFHGSRYPARWQDRVKTIGMHLMA
jgi:hypothetical protein